MCVDTLWMFVPFIYSLSDFTAGTYAYFCSFVHAVGPKALQAIQIDIEFEKQKSRQNLEKKKFFFLVLYFVTQKFPQFIFNSIFPL